MSMDEFKAPDCHICFHHYDDQRIPKLLPCGHIFCADCIGRFSTETCPECRAKFQKDRLTTVIQLLEVAKTMTQLKKMNDKKDEKIFELEGEVNELKEKITSQNEKLAMLNSESQDREKSEDKVCQKIEDIQFDSKVLAKIASENVLHGDRIHSIARNLLTDNTEISQFGETNRMRDIRIDYIKKLRDFMHLTTNGSPSPLTEIKNGRIQKTADGIKCYPYLRKMSYRELLMYTSPGVMNEKETVRLINFMKKMAKEEQEKGQRNFNKSV